MSIDILFVHPNASTVIYQDLSKKHSAIEPPIWAAMLAQHCIINGKSAEILDCEVLGYDYVQSANEIIQRKARIVCFVVYGQQPSASAQNMEGAVEVSKLLKSYSKNIKILFVGGYVSALPKKTLTDESSIDFLCMNEGVYTISNLLDVNDLNDKNKLSLVNGLAFRHEGQVILNRSERIVPKNLLEKDLPGMAWTLLDNLKNYRTAGWHSWTNNSEPSPFAAIYTSLGCPYKCSFCMINIINRTDNDENISSENSNIFRFWSPEFIIKQFDYLASQNIRNIKIADELFVLNPNHFLKICNLIIDRGYKFNIWAYSRVDTCKPKYLETLRKAGVVWLGLGIENPNNLIRKEVHKDSYKEVNISGIIKEIQHHDINVAANYIFGLPFETEESMKSTLDFAISVNSEMANFYCAMAYPGSPLYLESVNKGVELPKKYSGYSQHSYDTQNLPSLHLPAKSILKFRDNAWNRYHSNPEYLNLLEKKFGMKARKNIELTAKIKLRRKLLE
jgi:anaerobic magnesium-protoporphyrin IX monomethyl ester cyclase